MPIYEYRCNQCEREFERYVQTSQAAVECPACQTSYADRQGKYQGQQGIVRPTV